MNYVKNHHSSYIFKLNNLGEKGILDYIRTTPFLLEKDNYNISAFHFFMQQQSNDFLESCINQMLDDLLPNNLYSMRYSVSLYTSKYIPLIDFLQKTITYNELTEKLEEVPVNKPLGKVCKI